MVSEMTPKRRFLASLVGGNVDRRSAIVLSNFVVPLMEATGVSWPDCQLKPEVLAKFQAGRYEVCGLDSIFSHNDLVSEVTSIAGTTDIIDLGAKDRHPSVVKHIFQGMDPDDVSIPDNVAELGRNPIIQKSMKIIAENYGDTVSNCRVVTGPITVAGHLWGVEDLLQLSETNPDKFTQCMEIVNDVLIDICRDAVDNCGADSIYMPDPTASGDLLSPHSFSALMNPIYRKFTNALKDVPKFLHICGNTAPFLMHAPDSGFDAFSFEAPGCVTYDAKRTIGDRMALVGSLETVRVMMLGSPELVYKEGLENIRDGVDILCPACGTPPYTPLENIKALVEATKPHEQKKKKRRPKADIVAEFMPEDEKLKELTVFVMDGDAESAEKATVALLDKGYAAIDLVEKALLPGAISVAKLYDGGYVFVPEILLASTAMQKGISHCKEALSQVAKRGKIVMHVAFGDVHAIGKNIVATILEAKGYEVVDLGSSVDPQIVLDAVKKEKPDVVSGTSLMTSTRGAFPKIAKMLADEGFDLPFVIAGGSVDTAFAESMDFAIYADGPEIGSTVLEEKKAGKSWKDIRDEVHAAY